MGQPGNGSRVSDIYSRKQDYKHCLTTGSVKFVQTPNSRHADTGYSNHFLIRPELSIISISDDNASFFLFAHMAVSCFQEMQTG